jgi:hypothetical protein
LHGANRCSESFNRSAFLTRLNDCA